MPTPPSPRQDAERTWADKAATVVANNICLDWRKEFNDELWKITHKHITAALEAERRHSLEDAARVAEHPVRYGLKLDKPEGCFCDAVATAIRRLIAEGDKDVE